MRLGSPVSVSWVISQDQEVQLFINSVPLDKHDKHDFFTRGNVNFDIENDCWGPNYVHLF